MFQPDKITRLAISVFKEEGQVSIHGQGILKRMFLSAHLTEDKKKIKPPREHFYFNRNTHASIDVVLVHKVATYFILSKKQAEAIVQQWENWIVAYAQNQDVRFGEYGVFRYNEQLDFVSESFYVYEYLPTLNFQFTEVSNQELGIAKKIHQLSEKEKPRPLAKKILVPVLWSLLGVLFAFALFLWSEPLNLLIDQSGELNSRLVNVAPESYSIQDEKEYFNDTHGVFSSNSSDIQGENNSESPFIVHKSYKEDPNRKDEKHSERPDIVPSGDKSSKNNIENTTGSLEEITKRCTLIVGAFANSENVDRMVDQLTGLNVKVVTMERKTLTLVGADILCADADQIAVIKQEIEPNAWVYKK